MKGKIVNCRIDNCCVFCEFWLGKPVKVNHITGKSEILSGQGLCSRNDKYCEPTAICRCFKRRLLYL